ncbi:MAG: glycosyltransferase family 4 protein [Candidatus Helarchaeota archaeon]
MRIGYVVQQFYPMAYGSGVHAFELSRELIKLGHEIHIITKGLPTQKSYEFFQQIHIHRILPPISVPYYFPLNIALLWRFGKKIIKKLDLDVIIGHGFESSLFARVVKDSPFIYKAVGTIALQRHRKNITWRDHLGKFYFPLLGYFERVAIHHANFTIAISDAIKQEIRTEYNILGGKIYRIYNGVNLERFHPLQNSSLIQKQLGFDKEKIILFVGRLSPIKGPHLLLQAIPAILKEFPQSKFLFIGDGPLKAYFHKMIHSFRLNEHIKLLGFIPNSEIPQYFAIANLCIIPSLYEPFGLVALESLASETPILSSNRGGLAEIHQFLPKFPILASLSPFSLSKSVIELLSDPAKLKRLGRIGRKVVAQYFTWEKNAKKTAKLLEKL